MDFVVFYFNKHVSLVNNLKNARRQPPTIPWHRAIESRITRNARTIGREHSFLTIGKSAANCCEFFQLLTNFDDTGTRFTILLRSHSVMARWKATSTG